MTLSGTDRDARFMAAALSLARRNLGRVWPNPAVGCLIVDERDDPPRVLARGWTGEGGRPHAEEMALAAAGAQARGATAYVTLEPCAHEGRASPCCAEALVAAGVARVASAAEDPDPRVSGRGHRMLEEAGIDLEVGCLEASARALNEGFRLRTTTGRPHVTLKLAVSRDGMIAEAKGARTRITGEDATARGHMMRALTDAVMVGARTWAVDDPQLTCRLPGLAARSPVRIVLDVRAELPLASRLVATIAQTPLWVVTTPQADATRRAALGAAGAELIEIAADRDGRLPANEMLTALGDRGITRLLVEGGAALAASLLDAGLVDEAAIFEAPGDLGTGGVPAPAGLMPRAIEASGRFDLVSRDRLGADTLNLYRARR